MKHSPRIKRDRNLKGNWGYIYILARERKKNTENKTNSKGSS